MIKRYSLFPSDSLFLYTFSFISLLSLLVSFFSPIFYFLSLYLSPLPLSFSFIYLLSLYLFFSLFFHFSRSVCIILSLTSSVTTLHYTPALLPLLSTWLRNNSGLEIAPWVTHHGLLSVVSVNSILGQMVFFTIRKPTVEW